MENITRLAEHVRTEMSKVIVGQQEVIEQLLLVLICGGHALIEGVPGLAKTLAVKALAKICGLGFQRVQCTADLMPADPEKQTERRRTVRANHAGRDQNTARRYRDKLAEWYGKDKADKVRHAEAVSQAKAGMVGDNLDDKFAALEKEDEIEKLLNEIKSRRAG